VAIERIRLTVPLLELYDANGPDPLMVVP
jgi:hypothetical protein